MASRDTPTSDPFIVIEEQREGYVRYRSLISGERWVVRGTCNQCGLCVIGVAHPEHYEWHGEPGTPLAVSDLRVAQGRLDEPVAPGFTDAMRRMAKMTPTATVAGCSLTIESI
jgi:hypothetical protein